MIPSAVASVGRHLVLLGPAWTRAFRCVWMLEELDLTYHIDSRAMPVSKLVRQHVSTGKVPVLLEFDDMDTSDSASTVIANSAATADHQHQPPPLYPTSAPPSFVLSESSAINTYLGDQYGGVARHLIPPPGTRERATYDATVSCITAELDSQGLWLHRKHEAMAEQLGGPPNPAAVATAKQQFERINLHLAAQLHPYLLGPHFTAADILYVHCLDWSKGIGWHDQWPPHLEEYRHRCQQRPAYQRAKLQRDAGKRAGKKTQHGDSKL